MRPSAKNAKHAEPLSRKSSPPDCPLERDAPGYKLLFVLWRRKQTRARHPILNPSLHPRPAFPGMDEAVATETAPPVLRRPTAMNTAFLTGGWSGRILRLSKSAQARKSTTKYGASSLSPL